MEKKVKLLPPTMPNFIRYESLEKSRQRGNNQISGISVSELSKEEAILYGEFMKQEFIKHWEKKILLKGA